MKKILLLFCMMLSGLGWINTSNAQSVDIQFVESPNSDCANGTVCYVIQVRSDDGGMLLGSSSIRFNYDPSVILFDGFFQEGSTAGNYLNTGTYTDINFTSLPVCAGQNYLDHSYDGSIAGDFLITIVFNENPAFPFCTDLTSGDWIDVSEICFQIVNPSGNPLLEFQGNENGPATVSSFEDTNFNDGTNNVTNKYLNGSFGDYNTITLDNSCNCFPCICAPETPPTITTNSTILCPAGTTGGTSPILNAGSPAPTGYTYQWEVNGNTISGATGQTFSPTSGGTYTVYLVSTDTGLCDSASSNSIVITSGVSGCTNAAACNFNANASCDDGSCDLPDGCTDNTACNFNPNASCDNGTCILPNGCTDAAACNFDNAATCDDGTCEFTSCQGCTDNTACNFDPTATIEDGSCNERDCLGNCNGSLTGPAIPGSTCDDGDPDTTGDAYDAMCECVGDQVPGCTDPNACNYDMDATVDDGTCIQRGCTDNTACNFDPAAGCLDAGSCVYPAGCDDITACNYTPGLTCPDNSTCDFGTCAGCTDPCSANYDASATIDDGTCTAPVLGCMNMAACNFDPNALCSDATTPCDFSCYGCTDVCSPNYDTNATIDDNSCLPQQQGCTDNTACNYDPSALCDDNNVCEFLTCAGCTEVCAPNYDPTATIDDGNCMAALIGCTDLSACNYDPNALCADQSLCDYTSCIGTDCTLNIPMPFAGWHMISSYCNPLEDSITQVFSPIVNDVIQVKNLTGQVYVPSFNNFNTFTTWDITQGYLVKTFSPVTLPIIGGQEVDLAIDDIPLLTGWNMIAYWLQGDSDPVDVFDAIATDVIQVKNLNGAYVPSFNNFNNMGNMQVTRGYQVKMATGNTLEYDAVDILPRPAPGAYEETEILQPVHFTKEIKPNPNSATLIILDDENNPLNFGDELGIFTQDGILVGSFVYENDMMGGLAFGNDDTSDEMDGMKEGESYVFKVWNKLLDEVRTVEMDFSQGSTTYLKDDLCALSFKADASTGIVDINSKININANPNPASNEITFKIELEEQSTLLIEVFKVDGQLVEVVVNQNFNVGVTNVKYDVNNLSNGLYMYRVTMGDQVLTKRFTVAN